MKNLISTFSNRVSTSVDISKKFSAVVSEAGDILIQIYGDIGQSFWGDGITAKQVADALASNPKSVTIRINSPGGDAFEGVAIYNILKSSGKPVNVIVDGLAASAASIIAMAGDTVIMGKGTTMMIHPAMTLAYGNSADMRSIAEVLEKVTGSMADIYAERTGTDREVLLERMYSELWMNAGEAVELGFADSVGESASKVDEVAANYDLSIFTKAPETLCAAFVANPVGLKTGIAAATLKLKGLEGNA